MKIFFSFLVAGLIFTFMPTGKVVAWECHKSGIYLACLGDYGSVASCNVDNGAGWCNSTGAACDVCCTSGPCGGY